MGLAVSLNPEKELSTGFYHAILRFLDVLYCPMASLYYRAIRLQGDFPLSFDSVFPSHLGAMTLICTITAIPATVLFTIFFLLTVLTFLLNKFCVILGNHSFGMMVAGCFP